MSESPWASPAPPPRPERQPHQAPPQVPCADNQAPRHRQNKQLTEEELKKASKALSAKLRYRGSGSHPQLQIRPDGFVLLSDLLAVLRGIDARDVVDVVNWSRSDRRNEWRFRMSRNVAGVDPNLVFIRAKSRHGIPEVDPLLVNRPSGHQDEDEANRDACIAVLAKLGESPVAPPPRMQVPTDLRARLARQKIGLQQVAPDVLPGPTACVDSVADATAVYNVELDTKTEEVVYSVGDKVYAYFYNEWYPATVKELMEDQRYRVGWDGDTTVSDLDAGKLRPACDATGRSRDWHFGSVPAHALDGGLQEVHVTPAEELCQPVPGAEAREVDALSAPRILEAETFNGYSVGDAVEAMWHSNWFPGKVRRFVEGGMRVLWDAEGNISDIAWKDVRRQGTVPMAAAEPAQLAPLPAVAVADALALQRAMQRRQAV